MVETINYFIPPEVGRVSVLADELAPLPANACDAFIHACVADGGLVWDPFCRSDAVARAAARQGKRAYLSDFNPLIAFIVQATLHPVSTRQLDRAFATLAVTPTLQTTLEAYINSLYATTCPICGAATTARSYTWGADDNTLREKEFHCLTCNQIRRTPVDENDRAILAHIEERGRAYWSLLERLGASDGMLHPLGERLLDLYTPRSLYALSTIQSKLEMASIERLPQEVLMLALLEAMVQGIKTYVDDRGHCRRTGLARSASPRPAILIEKNCWTLFADACATQRARLEVESRNAPYLAARQAEGEQEAPQIVVRQASARRAAADIKEKSVDLILSAPPVLDWGDILPLTYLWTGWLLGKDKARRFSPEYLLRPKRGGDWPWFFAAMEKSFRAMLSTLKPAGKIVLCFSLTSLGYLNVLLLAAAAAGLQVENITYQPYAGESLRRPPALGIIPGYCYLRLGKADVALSTATVDDLLETARRQALDAAGDLMRERGEPTAYIWLHLAMLQRLSQTGLLGRLAVTGGDDAPPWDRLRQVLAVMEQGYGAGMTFIPWATVHEAAEEQEIAEESAAPSLSRQRGWWWLTNPLPAAAPVTDRAEWAAYTVLSTTPLPTTQAINRVVYALLPGLLTPEPGLVDLVLQSYATPASPIHWQLRAEDTLTQRTQEHAEMLSLLTDLGHRLGYRVWIGRADLRHRQHGQSLLEMLSVAERHTAIEDILSDASEASQLIDIVWYRNRQATCLFEVEWTAMLSDAVLRRATRQPGLARFLAVPAERADLIEAKSERLPLLRQRLRADDWRFIRFDALRELAKAETPGLEDVFRLAGLKRQPSQNGVQLTLL